MQKLKSKAKKIRNRVFTITDFFRILKFVILYKQRALEFRQQP